MREAVGPVLERGFPDEYDVSTMADSLTGIRDDRGRTLLRWLAVNAAHSSRLRAAETLLDTEDRDFGIDALVRLADDPPHDLREAVDLVRSLLLIGIVEHAVALPHRLIQEREPDTAERWHRSAAASGSRWRATYAGRGGHRLGFAAGRRPEHLAASRHTSSQAARSRRTPSSISPTPANAAKLNRT